MSRRKSALALGGLTHGAGVTDIVAAGGGLAVAGLVAVVGHQAHSARDSADPCENVP